MPPPNFNLSALYALDNLEVMRGMDSETVHLIYADPPFNSKRIYQGMPGTKAAAHRFRDTWSWNDAKEEWLDQIANDWPAIGHLVEVAKIHSEGMAGYLAFMSVRVIEMHRILRHDGSLYLHCDPTASAYLRNLLDAVHGADAFRNEVIWRRTHSKNAVQTRFGSNHDALLCYGKGKAATFNKLAAMRPYAADEIPSGYVKDAASERYKAYSPVYADGSRNGDSGQPATFRGKVYEPPPGRHWRVPGGRHDGETTSDGWARLDAAGLMYLSPSGKLPVYIRYLDEMPGIALDDVWSDIPIPAGTERSGWQTQKPLALLERIIKASSREGDIVFDPFCGCGTALVAAETLGRRWVGADDDANAVAVIRERLANLTGGVTQAPQMQNPVDVLYRPPQRTIVDTGKALHDPTGAIVPRKPSDRMTTREIRAKLEEWQTENDGLITCPGCAERLKPRYFHVDHINPKSLGGRNRIDNRILICSACNLDKSNTNTIAELWKAHGIRGKQRQQQQTYLKDLLLKADALIDHLDAAE